MKFSVSSYSFSQNIKSGADTQLSIIQKAADMGFDAIEFIDLTPPEGVSENDFAVQLKAEADRCGIKVAAYTISANLLAVDAEAEIQRLKGKVDTAALLGAPLLRHDLFFAFPAGAPHYMGFDFYLPQLADACRRITQYAMEKGVKTTTENHGRICQDPDRLERLVNTVAHENFGLLIDMGNFLCADCDPAYAVGRLARYALHAHAKDFLVFEDGENHGSKFNPTRGGYSLRATIIGNGRVPVKACVKALKLAGYDGYITVEFEGPEQADFAIQTGLDNLKRYLEELY